MIAHQILVNLTIAVISVGILLDLLWMIVPKERFRRAGGWLTGASALLAIVAVLSGLRAFAIVELPDEALPVAHAHRAAAMLTLGFVLFLASLRLVLTRLGRFRKPFLWGYGIIALATAALLFRTATMGGDMAYRYLQGQEQPATQPYQKPVFEE